MMLAKVNNGFDTMNDVLDRIFDLDGFRGYRDGEIAYPAVNIRGNEEGALVSVDLPGVEKDAIEISVEKGQILKISAERKFEQVHENEKEFLRESVSGTLKRVLRLPFRVDDQKTEAEYKNGVLMIRLYKSEDEKPKKIAIRGE